METRVLIQPGSKPNAANPLPQWFFRWNLITIDQLVLEIIMFKSVNAQMDGWTDAGSSTIL